MEQVVKGRFAPSPSGRMHLGNLYSALLAWLSARSKEGQFVLRLEDLDDRCRPEYAAVIKDDLKWLGLDWDEEVVQSERLQPYDDALAKLADAGLVYPCFCTRADLHAASAPHASDGTPIYAGTCRNLSKADIAKKSESRNPALRLMVPNETVSYVDGLAGAYSQNLADECGDFVLRRTDGIYAYQLVVVVDDAYSGITEVVRGDDLISSTPRQIYLQRLLGLGHPTYYHHPLLMSPDGRRLSKRDKDCDAGLLRERYTAPQLLGLLASFMGLCERGDELTSYELAALFDWGKVSKEPVTVQESILNSSCTSSG